MCIRRYSAGLVGLLFTVLLTEGWAFQQPATTGSSLQEDACVVWSTPIEVGSLDVEELDEASGVEVSTQFPGRLYHVNDSGDPGVLSITDVSGGGNQVVAIDGFAPEDMEDIAVGGCGLSDGNCLFIGDIGDNDNDREEVAVVVVEEQAQYGDTAFPLHVIRFRYPEGPQDAEALAMHPNGDLIILTRVVDYDQPAIEPSRVYRIPVNRWITSGNDLIEADLVGELDLPSISSAPLTGSLPTAIDISSDGSRLLVLTYVHAFEFNIDLSDSSFPPAASMTEGRDYREIDIQQLEQQESIAYLPGSNGFIYTTEFVPSDNTRLTVGRARIMQVTCGG